MSLEEIIKIIEPGDKAYRVTNQGIISCTYLSKHPRYSYYYFISSNDACEARGYYLEGDVYIWETNYDRARDIFKEKILEEFNILNRLYFNHSLEIIEK